MISRLRGEIVELNCDSMVVDCNGVGYEVLAPESVCLSMTKGEPCVIFVRQTFRENETTLYGFHCAEDRRLFDQLRDVKGCGPKTSLAIIGTIGTQAAASAVLHGDVRALAKAQGVGLKLAERIIVDLKDKVQWVQSGAVSAHAAVSIDDDLVASLIALGYRRSDAEPAAAEARKSTDVFEKQLKVALKGLQR